MDLYTQNLKINYFLTSAHSSAVLNILATSTVKITIAEPLLLAAFDTIPIHFKLAVSISLNFQTTQTFMYPDEAAIKTERIICKDLTI